MSNQLITHRLPIDYSLMSSIRYTWKVTRSNLPYSLGYLWLEYTTTWRKTTRVQFTWQHYVTLISVQSFASILNITNTVSVPYIQDELYSNHVRVWLGNLWNFAKKKLLQYEIPSGNCCLSLRVFKVVIHSINLGNISSILLFYPNGMIRPCSSYWRNWGR